MELAKGVGDGTRGRLHRTQKQLVVNVPRNTGGRSENKKKRAARGAAEGGREGTRVERTKGGTRLLLLLLLLPYHPSSLSLPLPTSCYKSVESVRGKGERRSPELPEKVPRRGKRVVARNRRSYPDRFTSSIKICLLGRDIYTRISNFPNPILGCS